MTSRSFVRVVGVVFLAVGVLGFFPGLKSPPPLWAPHLVANGEYGLLVRIISGQLDPQSRASDHRNCRMEGIEHNERCPQIRARVGHLVRRTGGHGA